jgi:SH3 domain protein
VKRALPLALWLLAAASAALADTRYVSDEMEVPVRSGKTVEHKILRMIPAGMAVEVLEVDPEGYSRVRAKGAEGWVLSRYLSEQPSARERLATLEGENAALVEQNRQLKEGLSSASAESQELHRSTTALREENAGLRREMEALRHAAARPAEVAQENERLRRELAEVQSDLESVRTRADVLGNAAYRQWFATGGGVAVAGLLLGLVLPRLYARRRRSSWDRL